jgi:hypothetical protein
MEKMRKCYSEGEVGQEEGKDAKNKDLRKTSRSINNYGIVGWNKHSGSTIIETIAGCAWLHPPCDLLIRRRSNDHEQTRSKRIRFEVAACLDGK